MDLSGKKAVFLGDSITEGHGTSGQDKIFMNIMCAKENMKACVNYGIGGTRIARQINPTQDRWDLDFCMRVEELDDDADIAVLFGGTNDFGHGDAPIGTMDDRDVHTFYGGCHHVMRRLCEKYPGKPIIVMTPLHRLSEDNPRGDGYKYPTLPLKGYVEIIREVAEYYSLPIIDLFACSGIQPKVDILREKFMPDGLHPNDAGHEIIAQMLTSYLKNL